MEDDIYVLSVGCMRQSLLVNQRCKHNFGLSTVCQFEENFLFKQQLILALWNKFKDFTWKLFNKQAMRDCICSSNFLSSCWKFSTTSARLRFCVN